MTELRHRKRKIKGLPTKKQEPENPERKLMRRLLGTEANEAELRLLMFLYLAKRDDEGWTAPISIATLMERIDKGRTSITDGLKKFKQKRWLESEKAGLGKACKYRVTIPQ